jgi:hypothetical protein
MDIEQIADDIVKAACVELGLRARLAKIFKLAQQGKLALGDHHLGHDHDPCVRGVLDEIERLAR